MPYNKREDLLLVKTIAHEFTRAKLALFNFLELAEKKTSKPKKYDNSKTRFLLYNSYAMFVYHLYEYQKGCFKREFKLYGRENISKIDELITNELDKFLKNCLILIEDNKTPPWIEGHRKAFYEKGAPSNFGKDFREVRNYLAHVDIERIRNETRLSLSEFYLKYHDYIMVIFQFSREFWEEDINQLGDKDLGDITEFASVIDFSE